MCSQDRRWDGGRVGSLDEDSAKTSIVFRGQQGQVCTLVWLRERTELPDMLCCRCPAYRELARRSLFHDNSAAVPLASCGLVNKEVYGMIQADASADIKKRRLASPSFIIPHHRSIARASLLRRRQCCGLLCTPRRQQSSRVCEDHMVQLAISLFLAPAKAARFIPFFRRRLSVFLP